MFLILGGFGLGFVLPLCLGLGAFLRRVLESAPKGF